MILQVGIPDLADLLFGPERSKAILRWYFFTSESLMGLGGEAWGAQLSRTVWWIYKAYHIIPIVHIYK